MGRRDLYLIYRAREERALAGYRSGLVTAGECQYDSCLAALARYPLEHRGTAPPRPRRGRRSLRPRLERSVADVARHLHLSRALLRGTAAAPCFAR